MKYLISEESLRYLLVLAARKALAEGGEITSEGLAKASKVGRDFDLRDLVPHRETK